MILKDKKYSILTFEYREDKKLFVLGANGGKNGIRLFQVLKDNLNHCEIFFERKTTNDNEVFYGLKMKNITKKSKGKIGDIYFNEKFLF